VPSSHGVASTFAPSLYDPAKAPKLYQPGKDAQGNRVAIDPTCPGCAPKPPVYIGLLVPAPAISTTVWRDVSRPAIRAGTDRLSGHSAGPAHRLRVEWTGDHKTGRWRGGFGMNYNPRNGSGILGDTTSNPDDLSADAVLRHAATFLQVGNYQAERHQPVAGAEESAVKVYNTSLGIQRESAGDGGGRGVRGQLRPTSASSTTSTWCRTARSSCRRIRIRPRARCWPDNFFPTVPGYGSIQYLSSMDVELPFAADAAHAPVLAPISSSAWPGTWSKALDFTEARSGHCATYLSPDVGTTGWPATIARRCSRSTTCSTCRRHPLSRTTP